MNLCVGITLFLQRQLCVEYLTQVLICQILMERIAIAAKEIKLMLYI